MTAEDSVAASGSSSTSTAQPPNVETTKSRRRQLQQQCLEPSTRSTAFGDQHVEAWLFLLGITEEHIQAHVFALEAQTLPQKEQSSSSSGSDIVKESESSSIPLDKDGWQVANEDALKAGGAGTDGVKEAASGDDGWKVVKSKKSRRKRDDETASTVSAPTSPQLGSKQSSPTEAASTESSSNPNGDANTPNDERLTHQHKPATALPLTHQQQYPNLSSRDIEQVAKDVERSFIGPAFKHLFTPSPHSDTPLPTKQQRRDQLSHLILTTLSRHPNLSYFQGYHDILTVLLLSLSPQPPHPSDTHHHHQAALELCAERLSLHVIRDSMTSDLLPIMGQLKLLSHLLHLCDPQMAKLVDRTSPLPFFALPWLLTLLTHDATSVEMMQRVVEFVLAYGPGGAIYLCAAVLMVKREEVVGMVEEEGEDAAMLHAVLGRLPMIYAEGEGGSEGENESGGEVQESAMYADPDVELPSLATDRALAASTDRTAQQVGGTSISTLLQQTVTLMQRYPLDTLHANTIMGPESVLFTWSTLFNPTTSPHPINWTSANTLAETTLTSPTHRIVLNPHPPAPPTLTTSNPTNHHHDEKHPKRNNAMTPAHNARMLAVVGLSGLIVAALITASQTTKPSTTADETKKVLTLIVSLISNWGRVVT
ncbi:related to GYP8-GTPase-activating protein [Sporisorium scitamineum]|uniref:Related to GYP8-GTPase-activating protein n=1 Tax=Sporisorium scitamineum TaxID=49012 RepID=A0A0F7RU22_9BASI|nr:hypothetical protein [Sporisorium scitamineum]CDU23563.1 related to GYP8-GTPase-activating protein [Sporisorium scitamineum]